MTGVYRVQSFNQILLIWITNYSCFLAKHAIADLHRSI